MQALKEVVRDRAGQGLNTIELALGTESAINREQSQQQGRESAAGPTGNRDEESQVRAALQLYLRLNNRDLHSDVRHQHLRSIMMQPIFYCLRLGHCPPSPFIVVCSQGKFRPTPQLRPRVRNVIAVVVSRTTKLKCLQE